MWPCAGVLLDQSQLSSSCRELQGSSVKVLRQEYWVGGVLFSGDHTQVSYIIGRFLLSEPQFKCYRYTFFHYVFHSILNTVPCAKMAILPLSLLNAPSPPLSALPYCKSPRHLPSLRHACDSLIDSFHFKTYQSIVPFSANLIKMYSS